MQQNIEIDGNKMDSETVKKFVKVARNRKDNFVDIFPWEISLDTSIMFIALTNARKLSLVLYADSRLCSLVVLDSLFDCNLFVV